MPSEPTERAGRPALRIALLAASSALVLFLGDRLLARGKPDVLLVLVDTLRADVIGAYGEIETTTPHLDRLSRRGAIYQTLVASSPWTKPSVASLLTGLTPREHGVRNGLRRDIEAGNRVDTLPEGPVTLPERMNALGFRSIAIQTNPHLRGKLGFKRGFDEYRDEPFEAALAVAREVVDLLRAPRRKPLFLFVQLLDPHADYHPRSCPFPALLDPAVGGQDVTLAELRDREGDREFRERARWVYLSEVFACDEAIGAMARAAEERGSVAAVTADHGEEFLDHGRFEHGHSLYEELLRVPLVIAGGRVGAALVPAPTPLAWLYRALPAVAASRALPDAGSHPITSESLLYGHDGIAIRDSRYKLLARMPGAVAQQLFDLDADPRELHPLPVASPKGRRLSAALGQYLERHHEARPVPYQTADPELERELRSIGYVGQ